MSTQYVAFALRRVPHIFQEYVPVGISISTVFVSGAHFAQWLQYVLELGQ